MTDFLTELREELLDGLERHERAPRSHRGGARRAIAPAARRAAAVAAAAAAIAGVVMVSDRSTELQQSPAPQVSRLEGFHASGFVAADGSLWVSEYDLGHVLRIDPQTGTVRARINVGGSPGSLINANGVVWVHDWERGRLIRVDPRTNGVAKTVELLPQANGDIAFAADALWMVGDRMLLLRVDPQTGKVTKRIALGGTATDPTNMPILAAAGDTLWVAGADGGAVTELDAQTGRILGRTRGPTLPPEIARRTVADDNGLWISSPTRRELIHIDADSRRATRIPLDADPGPIAIVDGLIWVGTLHQTGAVTRVTVLDDRGQMDKTFPVPHPTRIIVPTPGGAWVTFGENNTLSPAALRVPNP